MPHPTDPASNVPIFSGYNPNEYLLDQVSLTVLTDESLLPCRPPCQTQRTIGKFLQPATRALVEVPPRPTIDELPDAVIDNMVKKDKAFWVDKPGANAYTMHDVNDRCEMTVEKVVPHHQDVFPRSYQYDLDCVRYRRLHACDGLTQKGDNKKPLSAQCTDCTKMNEPRYTAFQLAWIKDPGQKRWKDYPDLTATLSPKEITGMMDEVGRPFRHEACTWYNKNYPSVKYECIMRKFSK